MTVSADVLVIGAGVAGRSSARVPGAWRRPLGWGLVVAEDFALTAGVTPPSPADGRLCRSRDVSSIAFSEPGDLPPEAHLLAPLGGLG